MTKRLLIDATHPEETRVVIADENRIHEFDISATTKTQNKGNIYLAKVTRVEPSLQAAFVEYGGGRQGFLPFSEIHPDYYQIPVADRKRLLEEAAQELEKAEAEEELALQNPSHETAQGENDPEERSERDRERGGVRRGRRRGRYRDRGHRDRNRQENQDNPIAPLATEEAGETSEIQAETVIVAESAIAEADIAAEGEMSLYEEPRTLPAASAEPAVVRSPVIEEVDLDPLPETNEAIVNEAEIDVIVAEQPAGNIEEVIDPAHAEDVIETISHPAEPTHEVETLGDEDEFTRRRKASFLRHYKIQEVIKRNQVILVQVVKEERGNKGASLTTYISLAGRYCVLMPNSPKTGGISRKISSSEDRKRLKEISEEIRTANGMSAIIRTAGIDRTRAEIKRDFDYLLKLWDQIRELTLSSTAPANVYEEADIIKRSLRDLYSSDIKDVVVAGEDAFKRAREFMKLMMPSHTARIKLHDEKTPIFYAYDVEDQLLRMHEPQVRLESGGSIVLNPTEALVSIDVNSGRSTTERNVEETALKTNLEAAQEIARQVRLRDLAGLIVIDFIDMFEYKNRRAVERQLKEALKNDRAKIQVGRISAFGLLEMSRQRMRPSLSETNTISCPHCDGKGFVLSPDAMGIQLLRFVEKEAASGSYVQLKLKVPAGVALHLLNNKRAQLLELEETHQVKLTVEVAAHIQSAAGFLLERITHDGQKTEINALDGIPSGGSGGGNSKRKRDRKRNRGRDREQHDHRYHADGRDEAEDGESYQEEESGENAAQNDNSPEDAPEAAGRGDRTDQERGEKNGRRRRGGRRNRNGRDRDRGERAPATPEQSEYADNNAPEETVSDTGAEAPAKTGNGRGGRRPRTDRAAVEEQPSRYDQPVELISAESDGGHDESSAEGKSSKRGWWRRMVE